MKKFTGVLLAACMLASLTACGADGERVSTASSGVSETSSEMNSNSAKTKVTFSIWDEVQQPVFEKIVDDFEKENPDIDVELQLTPWSQYWTKLDAAMGADTAADVFWINTFMPKYAEAGVLEPLNQYIKEDGIDMDDYVNVVADMYNYKGAQYGMPKGMDTVQVFYNKAIFEKYGIEEPKEGWTWGEMVQTAQALKEKNSDVYPILMELDPQPSYFNFIEQSGGYVLDDTGKKTGLGTPGAIKAYQDVVDLMDQGLMPDNQVLSDTKGTDLFLSQKGAMLFMGSWKCAVLDAASFADQLGTVSMPAREEGNQSVIGGLGYAMNANSKNKEAAWKLIKFLAGEKANRMQAEARIDIPALKSAQQYYKTDHVDSSVIFKAADSGFAYPTSPSVADWNQVITDYSNKIFSKEMTAEEGCEKMGAEVQAILDKE
ncbi:MAG: sugar ABC transporter substrate-binding protein [Eubacterium sp.]|jgi:multiple sugar transport system substrate-binding protein|nr:sugar ABC transporter substrate-binding protein [Eubacterium sp.]